MDSEGKSIKNDYDVIITEKIHFMDDIKADLINITTA